MKKIIDGKLVYIIDDRPLEEKNPELAKRLEKTPEEFEESMRNWEKEKAELMAEREFKGFRWNGKEWIYRSELDERKKQTNE